LNIRGVTLKAALLRHTGRKKEALAVLKSAHGIDPLDVRVRAERWLAGDKRAAADLSSTLLQHPATGLEIAAEFDNAGLWQDGLEVLSNMALAVGDDGHASPLVYYYLGHFAEKLGDSRQAADYRQLAASLSPEYVFPFQWETIHALRRSMEANPQDAHAPNYLGNLLYDWQPDEAAKLWERSASLAPSFAMAHRNLALACQHRKPAPDTARAIAELERAVACPEKYAMHFAELDELYETVGKSPEERLGLLERNHAVVAKRDDSLSREIGLKVFAGKYDAAIALMTGRTFSVWEGGTLDVANHWVNAHLLRGQEKLRAGQFAAALADFQAADKIPENLPSDRGNAREREAELAYWAGLAHEALGDTDRGKQSWQRAVSASSRPRSRRNPEAGDRVSERSIQVYYQALANRKLGREDDAKRMFDELVESSSRVLQKTDETSGSSAAPGEAKSSARQRAMAQCISGLGHLGLDEKTRGKSELESALRAAPDLLPAKTELTRLPADAK
jgi:tetratricopeptide (TPR) repeat protein